MRRSDLAHIAGGLLDHREHAVEIGLQRFDRALPGADLFQRAADLLLDRIPFRKPGLEARQPRFDLLQVRGAVLDVRRQFVDLFGPHPGLRDGGVQLLGDGLELLRRVRRLLAQVGGALEIFGRFLERLLPLLQLRTQRARALFQFFDRLATRDDRGHRLLDLARALGRFVQRRRHGRHRQAHALGLFRMRAECDKPLFGSLHALVQLLRALVEPGSQRTQLGETAVQVVDELTPRLDRLRRIAHALGLLERMLDCRRQAVEFADLSLELFHRLLDARQPGVGLRLALADAQHFLVRDLRLLHGVLDQRVGAAQALDVLERDLNTRPQFLDALHLGAHLARLGAGRIEITANRAQLHNLALDVADLLGQRVQLRGRRLRLPLQLDHGLAGFAQGLVALLEVGEGTAQVGDPLADGLKAAALEVEALDGIAHFIRHGGKILSRQPRLLVGLALQLRDLAGAVDHRLVQAGE